MKTTDELKTSFSEGEILTRTHSKCMQVWFRADVGERYLVIST